MSERHEPNREPGALVRVLQRIVEIREEEVRVVFLSSAYFFLLLTSYYIIRPVRDEMAVAGGVENLAWLFTGTLVGMLLAHPLFTALVARYPRKVFIPVAYRFFATNLLLFFVLLKLVPEGGYVWVGRIFYNWVSVFNLFVVSVFWAFMADIFRSEQGKRLFGFIGVGGTLGAILGAGLTATLARVLGPVNLLLLSALALELAVQAVRRLGHWVRERELEGEPELERSGAEEEPIGGGVLAGITGTVRSPYLLAIVLYMLLFAVTNTSLYFHQAEIVSRSFGDPAERTAFFARIDFLVNVLVLVTQTFLTGRIIRWVGLGVTLALLPALSMAGFTGLGLYETVAVIVLFQTFRRAGNYAVMRPAMEVLYTVVSREEKYKAKNFIDTFVYRAGDQIGAWSYTLMGWMGLGLGAIALVNVPVSLAWLVVGLGLGWAQRRRAEAEEGPLPSGVAPAPVVP